ncbi:MAG: nucleoside monophosphate kinase [Candidatus Aenigmatarchaeota archaeon]
MRLILLGIRCSGKGTCASRLSSKLGIPHISTGEIFRSNISKGTLLGKMTKEIYNKGGLVPDDITLEVVGKRLKEPDCKNGFILDGFPRTVNQAKGLEEMEKIDHVIYLDVDEDIVLKRLLSRVVCKECGDIYNTELMKPKKEGVCDKCGAELHQKADDKPEAAKHRIEEDDKNLKPLMEYYKDKGILRIIGCEKVDLDPDILISRIMEKIKVE